MKQQIPAAVLAVTSDLAARLETHASLDSLFTYAGAPGDPPDGMSKHAKAQDWLRRVNKSPDCEPLKVLGSILEPWLGREFSVLDTETPKLIDKLNRALADADLQYVKGGRVVGSLGSPTRALADFIRELDFDALGLEFERATKNAEASPREAVSAASNILESTCKMIIADDGLEAPAKQDLGAVWNVVRKHLAIDPSRVEDDDLQKILSGLISVVHGIGSLRTHASSAHGSGRKSYKLEPRHARLAIHAAHTLTLFVLETWKKRAPKS